MRFSPYDMHVERLAAPRGTDAEEIGVVGHLDFTLLAGYVDAHGQTLTVGVVGSKGRVLAPFEVFLEEQAQGRVAQCEEQVIVGVEGVCVAGEGGHEKFKLVIRRARRHDAALVELGLEKRGHRGNPVSRTAHDDIEIGIDKEG